MFCIKNIILGTGCIDLRTGNCYTEYNTSRNGLSVCGGDITTVNYEEISPTRGRLRNMTMQY